MALPVQDPLSSRARISAIYLGDISQNLVRDGAGVVDHPLQLMGSAGATAHTEAPPLSAAKAAETGAPS